jgi:hypothetical protein
LAGGSKANTFDSLAGIIDAGGHSARPAKSADIEENMKTKTFSKHSFKVLLITILLLVAIPVTTALAAASGPNYPGTPASGGGAGDTWGASSGTLATALGADGGTTASVTLTASTNGAENLDMTNFGFSIPTTATITGISVEMNRWSSSATGLRDETVRLLKGSAVGNNKASATDWNTVQTTVVMYGSSSDVWGTTWTPAEVNNSNFGVTLDVDRDNGGNITATVDYVRITITYKENPTLSVSNSPVTYDGTAKSATVTGSVAGSVSDIRYGGSTTVPTNAGTYVITADFTPTDTTSYNSLNDAAAGNFVIDKANQATLVAVVTPSTVVYGSTATLSSTGGSGTGAVTFSDGASTGCSVSGTTLSVTDASGTCSITATKATDTNYLAATSAAAPVTLQKAATTTTVTGGTFIYDGNAHAATASVTGPGGLSLTPSPSYSGSCSAAPATVAEGTTCTADYNYAGNNNYLPSSDSATVTINAKAASVTPNAASKTYGASDPTLTGSLSGFLPADNVTATYSREAGETVPGGPYSISAALSPAGVLSNYAITSNTANFTINPKAASVTPAAASKTYGAADPALTGSLSGFLPADNVTATYSREAGETVLGGPYVISAQLSPAGVLSNYAITNNTADFTIDVKAASVTPNAASKIYGAADPALTGTLSGFLPADNVTAAYSREPGETVAGGPYVISAELSPAGVLSNYAITGNTADFTISPKAASVTPEDASKTYGAADPALTGSLSGFLPADNVTAVYSREAGETVLGGPYTISAALSPTGVLSNYTVTSNTADFTIDPKAASVSPAAASKTYGAADPALTGTLLGFLPADNVTATYSREAGETVLDGPYTISAQLSPAGVLSNYTITSNTANFTINPKAASVTPNAASKTYGAADPTLTGSLTGFLPADDVTATYSREPGETVLGGPYTITAELNSVGALSNYAITNNTAAFTINPKTASVTPNAASKTYGAADPTPTGTLSGFLPADNVTATYSRAAGETVLDGPYAIGAVLSPAGVLSNYTITGNTADFTITPAGLTISGLTANDKPYDGNTAATLSGTAALTGVLGGDTVTLGGTPVATFADANIGTNKPVSVTGFTLGGADGGNYSLTQPTGLTASITSASVTVTGITASNKIYDGDTTATLDTSSTALVGVVDGDDVQLDSSAATGTFATKVVGTGKIVTISGLVLTGADADKYQLIQPSATADITAKDLTVSAVGINKVYNGTLAATVNLSTDVLAGDTVTPAYSTASFADKNAGTGKPVTVNGISISGADAGNYNLLNTTANTTATITSLDITVTAHAKSKVVGTTDPALTYSVTPSLFGGDAFTGALTRAAGETEGSYAIQQGTLTAGSNYNITYVGADLTIVANTSSNLSVYIGNNAPVNYVIAPSVSTRDSYAGVNTGPVRLTSTNGISIMAAERVIYKVNKVNTSFSEMMALPNSQLDTTYWLPWYNNVDLDTQLRIGNVSGATATVHVWIGTTEVTPVSGITLLADESQRLSYAGVNNGPVKIVSDQNIVAAERVIYKINNINTSFSEMMALPNSQLDKTYWLPWYNNVDLDTQLRIGNVSGATATVHIWIGTTEVTPVSGITLLGGESQRLSYPGVNNGPVKIVSDQNIVAAERVIYKINNTNTSFSEMMALPNKQLDKTYWLPWYNNVDLDTQLRIGNVSGETATIHIWIGTTEVTPVSGITLLAGESQRLSYPGMNSGPVKIVSDQNIVVAERVIYKVNKVNTSFSEMMALPNQQLDTTYWLPWYNNVDLDTQLRFGVP